MNKMIKQSLGLCAALAVTSTSLMAQAIQVDSKLPDYKQVSGVTGNLNAVGSDSMVNMMALWTEGFKSFYPNVNIQTEGKGSGTAPVALIEGTAQLGPMSRAMRSKEFDEFEKKYGYKPTEIKVAIDALAVFVHKDNPIKSLTLQQVDGIISSTRKLGGQDLTTWGQVGLTGAWANRPFSIYGRNSASGTYGFFKDVALGGGDYRATVKEQPGSSAVVQGIGSDLGGIGYSGIGYATSDVRAIALEGAEPNPANAVSGKYPLARFLYVYINKAPTAPADKLTGEFIKFAVSKQGQEVVVRDGYFPMPATASAEEVKKTGL